MLSRVIFVGAHDMKETRGVKTSFYIEAKPIVEESQEEVDLSKEISWNVVNSAPIVSDFKTVLFPNNGAIEKALQAIADKFEDADNLSDDEYNKLLDSMPVINLSRFAVDAPKAYFRRYYNDSEDGTIHAGDFIVASESDEFLPNDPYKRKLFKSITVTSLVKIDEKGVEVAAEDINRKAAYLWRSNLEINDEKGFSIFEIAEDVMKKEAVRDGRTISPAQKEEANDAPQFSRRR